MKPLVSVSRLTKSYGRAFTLGPLDLSLAPGEVLGILGPNGGGKTTCLRIIAGLLKADGGEVSLGEPHPGYMSEELSLWPDLSGREQIDFLNRLYTEEHRVRNRRHTRRRGTKAVFSGSLGVLLNDLIAGLELEDYLDRSASRLSHGNQRKLSFLLSVVHNPALLILDEPFNGLDALSRRRLSRWLKRRVGKAQTSAGEVDASDDASGLPDERGAAAVLISSHQLEELENCADRILILRDGLVIREYLRGREERSLAEIYHGLFAGEDDQ